MPCSNFWSPTDSFVGEMVYWTGDLGTAEMNVFILQRSIPPSLKYFFKKVITDEIFLCIITSVELKYHFLPHITFYCIYCFCSVQLHKELIDVLECEKKWIYEVYYWCSFFFKCLHIFNRKPAVSATVEWSAAEKVLYFHFMNIYQAPSQIMSRIHTKHYNI